MASETPSRVNLRLRTLVSASVALALAAGGCSGQTTPQGGPGTAATQPTSLTALTGDEPRAHSTSSSAENDTARSSAEAPRDDAKVEEHAPMGSLAPAEPAELAASEAEQPVRAVSPASPRVAGGAHKTRARAPRAAMATGQGFGSGGLGLSGVGQGGGGYGMGIARRTQDVHGVHPGFQTEGYDRITDNEFLAVADHPLSTFSADVDTASYSNMRRFLRDGQLPPKDAVRVEELLNYFSYDYPEPKATEPFSVTTEVSACPWEPEHRLVHVGLRGTEIAQENVPPRNLVFLVDVSGSMQSPDKLPLLKRGLSMLARNLRPQDSVAVAVYAGASGLALPVTSGRDQSAILAALDQLEAGGSTNGAEGIQLAYDVAKRAMRPGGINRVILATDGDFNVGTTSRGDLSRLIEEKRESGIYLTVLGFGRGNVKDSTMESLADQGNGNYAYIDSVAEARKVLVREAGATLVTIAKDVKLQVEFNPALVESYRLVGYENRVLAKEDFNDDKKDAGEIGAGHTVTAIYEVVPKGAAPPAGAKVDPLKYQKHGALTAASQSSELATVKLRYKAPRSSRSTLISVPVADRGVQLDRASDAYRFSAAVAGFGMLLRDSKHKGGASLGKMRALAASAVGRDANGDRRELLALMDRAGALGLR